MRKIGIIILITVSLHPSINAQTESYLDSMLATLDNKDLFVSPIIGGVFIGTEEDRKEVEELKNAGMVPLRKYCTVASFPGDFELVLRQYSLQLLVSKLYPILMDKNRDYYAHALLTELFFPAKLCRMSFLQSAEEWQRVVALEKEKKLWRSFLVRNGYITDKKNAP